MREVCLRGEVGASRNFEHSRRIEPSPGGWRLGQAPLHVTLATAGYPRGLYYPTLGAFDGYTLGLGKVVLKLSVPRAVLTGGQKLHGFQVRSGHLSLTHASASLLVTDHASWYPNITLSPFRL